MPSTGDASDRRPPGPAPLVTAVRLLADREVYGLVWLDRDLVVESTYGKLVDFVGIGEPVIHHIYALAGLEDEITGLRERPGGVIELPDVTLVTAEGRRPRANLSVSWSPESAGFIVLVARTGSRSDLEIELVAQMRARLMAESELAAKTRELQRVNGELSQANADLEAYASIISHDLQSPMRMLRYMVDDLETALDKDARGDAIRLMDSLRAQSRRMTGMLAALLEYSAVTRKADAVEPVDTAALVRAIVASVDMPPGFDVVIAGDWPRVATLPALLDLVLRNLIDNAVKHHDRGAGTIELTAFNTGSVLVMTIADDGPGIPPGEQQVIFLPFRKLTASEAAPGQGMGLALVRRAVEGMGGQISVGSATSNGRGTVFTVHWPLP
jgi:signal transduction histidine kinase